MNNDNNSDPFEENTPIDSTPEFNNSGLNPIEDDNKSRPLTWILLSIVLLGCGAIFVLAFLFFQPNATKSLVERYFPSPTATITPTATPNLTATADMFQATAISAREQWPLGLKETFDNNTYHWYVGTDDNSYDKVTYAVQNGKYRWNVTAHKGFVQWIRLSDDPLTDFYLTVDAQETSNPALGEYGIIFREDKYGDHYYFAVTQGGQFYVSLYNKEKWTNLIASNYSEFIQQNESNQLTIWSKGSHFLFFINGHYVGEATDDQIPEGKLGIAVGLDSANTQSIFEFDNVELRSPAPPATATPTPNLTATQQVIIESTNTAEAFQATVTSAESKWKTVFADNFDSKPKNWDEISSDIDNAKSIIEVIDGKYSWDIESHQPVTNWAIAPTRSLKDFVLNVDARQISGPSTADYGVIFREDSSFHTYYFGINNNGEYVLQLYNTDWIDLINYTKSELIHPGEVNHITIVAEGSEFTFFINGQYLTQVSDQRLEKGQAGLTATLQRSNEHAVFEFDNFELRAP